jgi:hypothetical protein
MRLSAQEPRLSPLGFTCIRDAPGSCAFGRLELGDRVARLMTWGYGLFVAICSYGKHPMAPAKSSGVLFRRMTNNVMLHAGQPASVPLRRRGDSPCRILRPDDEDDIRRLNVGTLIHAEIGTVTRKMAHEGPLNRWSSMGTSQKSTGLFLLCAVVAHHRSRSTNLYEGVSAHSPYL